MIMSTDLAQASFWADHTYRMVIGGTMLIGGLAGALGVFAYLRRQSMLADVVSHAALPGALVAFLVINALGGDGRSLVFLLLGAVGAGWLAAAWSNEITRTSRIRIDSAMAIALTVYFGCGMLLLRLISQGDYANKGGVQYYLFGNAAVMTRGDIAVAVGVAAAALITTLLFWRRIQYVLFDANFAATLGLPITAMHSLIFGLIAVAVVAGIKAVGLVLMVAFMITPAAIARQWVSSFRGMVLTAGVLGAGSAAIGAYLSIIWQLPTGPVIVLLLFGLLLISLVTSPRARERWRAGRAVAA